MYTKAEKFLINFSFGMIFDIPCNYYFKPMDGDDDDADADRFPHSNVSSFRLTRRILSTFESNEF